MVITKKYILYGAIALVIVAGLAIAGATLLRTLRQASNTEASNSTNTSTAQQQSVTEEEAVAAIDSAKKAQAAGKYDDATASYQKARKYYEISKNIEKIADIDAALNLLTVEKKNAPSIMKAPIAGQE
jgi:cation transport regulator ChaC